MKIPKEEFSEWYNTIIKEAKLCDLRYNIKGFIVILPWAMETIDKIYKLYDKELESTNHKKAFFPSLVSEKNFSKESSHVEGFTPEVLWVTMAGDKKLEEKYALRPTGEAVIYPMFSLWIQGLKDLPIKIYQKTQVWRYETKATKPFIRGREFLWIEAHDAFSSKNEALKQIKEDMEITKKIIWEKLGIPYLFLKRPEWDKFAGAVDTYAADVIMPDGKVLQITTTHFLGQNFSKAFDIKFKNEKGNDEFVWQTCFGPGINRIYAAMISTLGDEYGLILPVGLSPIDIVVVPIIKKGEEKVLEYAKKIAKKLDAYLDDSENTPGFKFNYWERLGVPIRIEIGKKEMEEKKITIKTRIGKRKTIDLKDFNKEKIEEEIIKEIKKRNIEEFKKKISFDIKDLKNKKIVYAPFCGKEECAKKIKEEYNADVRGGLIESPIELELKKGKKCVVCGEETEKHVFIAKSY